VGIKEEGRNRKKYQ